MKNKRMVLTLIVGVLITAAIFGRDYDLDERESINLSGVNEVVFKLEGVSCSLCVRTLNVISNLRGDGSGQDMTLTLSGNISSNREKAVPSLIIDEGGRTVTVQLYPDRQSFFGLSQSGTVNFEAILPSSFNGTVTVTGSSDDISLRSFEIAEMDVESSSGDLTANDIRGKKVSLKVSSGDFRGDGIFAENNLSIKSSSGDVELGLIEASDIVIEASSGEITIDNAQASGKIEVNASSGRITGGRIAGGQVLLDNSSGKIIVETLEAGDAGINVSSGDVQLGTVVVESLDIKLSSGDLKVNTLDSNRTEINTSGKTEIKSGRGEINLEGSSGDVNLTLSDLGAPVNVDVSSGDITVTLPEGSAFDAELDTSSGRIRSEFPVLGDLTADGDELSGTVNGGGVPIKLKTSSGNIDLLVQ
jgi:DUF4097 and DUF4098 domain-containing protein YvlB